MNFLFHNFQRAVVIAVVAVGVVQVAIDQIVDMVTVGHSFVAAAWAVNVAWLVAVANVCRGTGGWVGGTHSDHVFVHMVTVGVVQMAVVQVVHMAIVTHSGVAAAWTVLVGVVGVGLASAVAHGDTPISKKWIKRVNVWIHEKCTLMISKTFAIFQKNTLHLQFEN